MKPGDYVIWTERSDSFHKSTRWGRVVDVSPAGTVKAKIDKLEELKVFKPRRNYGGYANLRLATDEEIAMRQWRAARPKTALVAVFTSTYSSEHHVNLDDKVTRHAADPVKLREVAAELIAVADWLERRPK